MELPDDIREKAWLLVSDQMCSDGVCTFQNGCGCFETIARALLERDRAATERAAKIADDAFISAKGMKLDAVSVVALQDIAAAIRSQP